MSRTKAASSSASEPAVSVASEDIRAIAHQVLRHRVLVNFHGRADGVTPDRVVDAVLAHVPPVHGSA